MLGDTYRVRILSKANTAIRATSRSTRLSTKRKFVEDVDAALAIAATEAEAEAQLALENAKEATSNNSNSSSNRSSRSSGSSSSSDRKKYKKSKKNKKADKKDKKSKKSEKDKKNKNNTKEKKEKKGRKASCISIYSYVGCRPCIGCVMMCCICVLKRFVALGLCIDFSLLGRVVTCHAFDIQCLSPRLHVANVWSSPHLYIYKKIIQDTPETPSEKKARLAMERAVSQKSAKAAETMLKLATVILSKVSPAKVSLDSLLSKPETEIIPMIIKGTLVHFAAKFASYEENAKEVIESGGRVSTMVDDIKDLTKEINEAKRQSVLAGQMLATLARSAPEQ